jgi:hypothetical protein
MEAGEKAVRARLIAGKAEPQSMAVTPRNRVVRRAWCVLMTAYLASSG